MTNRNELTSTFKSLDTEEWLDIHFTRPIGLVWAKFFNRLNIHPNVVTVLSIILGMAAAVMFYYSDLIHNIIGVLLLMWANFYDSADGQLARMTGKKTQLGRVLDGFAGDVWFFSIYFCLCLRLTPEWGVWIWLLAAFSGFVCHAKQCQLADYYRNIHLYFLKGTHGSELENSCKLKKEFDALSWKGHLVWKVFLFFYRQYTVSQEKMTPVFQRFKRACDERFSGCLPQRLRDDFRSGSRPLMMYANILTFNVRAIVLYVVVLVDRPWIYFIFEITVMSALFFYMRARHEKLCRQLLAQLNRYEG